ncbi:hypothetical protein NAT47_07160 [Flavobacterium sp. HXWNR69]|uniref:Uncharacterized protein n=1 Tax=Flavobacterium fragile TaxID=2949085 RepID=A0ABT0THY0_9FLAO|nr:hypothetical protein [Flavobacterium sp. HXWNR69]MCL9770191.1 hypothetical protein [Flavobacterium sp. HXWNR69]
MKNIIYLFMIIFSSSYSQQNNRKYWIGKEIKSESGFLLQKENFDTDFGIAFSYSDTKTLLLFFKIENTKKIIIDILEIDKKELQGNKLTEYCHTIKGADAEIIALVKETDNNAEFYTKIKKAWRANRKIGKFEKIAKRKVKKCSNENYGN